MSVVSIKRRLGRLDHGESPEVRALEKLTDDELEVLIQADEILRSRCETAIAIRRRLDRLDGGYG
jgi:hypothetical protein